MNVGTLMAQIRRGFADKDAAQEAGARIENAGSAPFLVLDDLGKVHPGKDVSWVEETFYAIIDARYRNALPDHRDDRVEEPGSRGAGGGKRGLATGGRGLGSGAGKAGHFLPSAGPDAVLDLRHLQQLKKGDVACRDLTFRAGWQDD